MSNPFILDPADPFTAPLLRCLEQVLRPMTPAERADSDRVNALVAADKAAKAAAAAKFAADKLANEQAAATAAAAPAEYASVEAFVEYCLDDEQEGFTPADVRKLAAATGQAPAAVRAALLGYGLKAVAR